MRLPRSFQLFTSISIIYGAIYGRPDLPVIPPSPLEAVLLCSSSSDSSQRGVLAVRHWEPFPIHHHPLEIFILYVSQSFTSSAIRPSLYIHLLSASSASGFATPLCLALCPLPTRTRERPCASGLGFSGNNDDGSLRASRQEQ